MTSREALARRRAALSPEARAVLAERLRGGTALGGEIPRSSGGSADAPLSFTQEQFWLRQQAFPDDPSTNVFVPIRLRGQLDPSALQDACTELVRRHDVLRSRFVEIDGEPRQRVLRATEFPLRRGDLSGHGAGERGLEELARAESERPFDLTAGPPVRGSLVRLAEDDHALLLTIHHIATDAWSNLVLLEELATLYRGAHAPLTRPLQLADYARWQRDRLTGDAAHKVADYWRAALSGVPRGLELPTDRPRSTGGTRRSARLITSVPAEHFGALVRFCQSIQVPTFAGLMAVLQTLLYRYSGMPEFLVGVPFSGRQRPELMRVVGPLFTTIPLPANVSGSPTFTALASRVRAAAAEAFNHSAMPADRFLTATRGTTPFDVLFALQDGARPAATVPGLTIEQLELGDGTAQCPLTLSAIPAEGGLRVVTDYDRELFEPATITALLGHFGRLVELLPASPEVPVDVVPMLTSAERATIVVDWNRTTAPRSPVRTLPELFHQQVRRTPDAPALRCGDERLSYVELERRAVALAARLGVGRGDIVGVCLERSTELVVTLLAVLISGAAYLPLDPAHPAERRERAVRQSGARMVLTGNEKLPEPQASRQRPAVDPHDLAYLIYTSGSTGMPKGVLVAHDGVCNNAAWRREITGLGPGDRLLHTVSFAFDPSVWQLFGPLLAGAEVIMAEQRDIADPERFAELVAHHRVTIADFVPSVLASVLEVAPPGALDSLTHVFCGGERLPRDLADRCRRELRAVLHNQYGPTEATIDTTSHLVLPDEPGEVPIGRPIANKRVYVLDRRLEPVPAGVTGELWIGGTGLAYGYAHAATETAARFLPDPFGPAGSRMYRSGDLARHRRDGALEFLGRVDDQVKVNGVRIEPAEIAETLRRHPTVSDAVVVLREVDGRPALVAYVVLSTELDGSALRHHVAGKLPPAFVPAQVVAVDAIPLGVTGKVATERLPEVRVAARPRRTVQPGSVEDRLVTLWREVLGQDLGVDDDFFALGGDSLLAVRLVAAVRTAFSVELTLPEFFEATTVAALASVITTRRATVPTVPRPALIRRGANTAPLSFAQERVYRRALAGARSDELHLSMVARLRGDLDTDALGSALHMVVTRHEALRVAIANGQQVVQAPYRISLDSPGGDVSLETGQLLDASLESAGPTEHVLTLTLHRIAADGLSSHILARDLALCYGASRAGRTPELPALGIQHPDYAYWERATLTTVDDAVRDRLSELGELGDLSRLVTAPRSTSTRRERRALLLDPSQVRQLSTVAREHRRSLRTVLQTVWATACVRHLGEELVACVPVSGRDQPVLQQVVGRFVNQAVLAVRLDHASDFATRLELVGTAAQQAYQRERDVPFLVLEQAIDPGRSAAGPVFPLLFDVADPPGELPAVAGLEITVRPSSEHSIDFGLALQAQHEQDGLELALLHDPELYGSGPMTDLFDEVRAQLDGVQ